LLSSLLMFSSTSSLITVYIFGFIIITGTSDSNESFYSSSDYFVGLFERFYSVLSNFGVIVAYRTGASIWFLSPS